MTTAQQDVERVSVFAQRFKALTGNSPYPWQESFYSLLLSGKIPGNINLLTVTAVTDKDSSNGD
jgi:hypothetical protein